MSCSPSIVELIGHEEIGGGVRPRPDGIEHRAEKGRRPWRQPSDRKPLRTLGQSASTLLC